MDLDMINQKLLKHNPTIMGIENFLKFSVLVPLIEQDDDIHILFEVRSYNLRRQPGEICLPGGKIDHTDRDEKHTAIRETTEELGITENQITNASPLDYFISPFGTIIYPFVGTILEPEKIKPNPAEVAEVFTVPLSYFTKTKPDCYKINFQIQPEEGFPFELIHGGKEYKWQTRGLNEYFYQYNGKVIWGLTAQVLFHFINMLKG